MRADAEGLAAIDTYRKPRDPIIQRAWDPITYIPYVVSLARSWGRAALRDGSTRFCRSSLQRGWITPEEGLVLEEVFVSDAKQTIYFLGRPRMVEENGKALMASPFQPLFHVRHAVSGSEQAPLNLWSIVLLTNTPDLRYCMRVFWRPVFHHSPIRAITLIALVHSTKAITRAGLASHLFEPQWPVLSLPAKLPR